MHDRVYQSRLVQVLATAGPVALVIVIARLAVRAVRDTEATRIEQARIQRTVSAMDHVLRRFADAEKGQRGFTATGTTWLLAPLRGAEASQSELPL